MLIIDTKNHLFLPLVMNSCWNIIIVIVYTFKLARYSIFFQNTFISFFDYIFIIKMEVTYAVVCLIFERLMFRYGINPLLAIFIMCWNPSFDEKSIRNKILNSDQRKQKKTIDKTIFSTKHYLKNLKLWFKVPISFSQNLILRYRFLCAILTQ